MMLGSLPPRQCFSLLRRARHVTRRFARRFSSSDTLLCRKKNNGDVGMNVCFAARCQRLRSLAHTRYRAVFNTARPGQLPIRDLRLPPRHVTSNLLPKFLPMAMPFSFFFVYFKNCCAVGRRAMSCRVIGKMIIEVV